MEFCTLRVWVKEAGQKRGRAVFDFFLARHAEFGLSVPIRQSEEFLDLAAQYPVGTLFKVKEQRH